MTRVLVFSAVGFVLLTLLGPLQLLVGLEMATIDVSLIIVLYLAMADRGGGLTRSSIRAPSLYQRIDWTSAVIALVLGYLVDVLAGGPKGTHALTLLLTYLLSRVAARHVFMVGTISMIVLAFVASLASTALGLGVRWFIGVSPGLGSLRLIGAQAVLCAAVAPLLIRALAYLDARLAGEPSERGSIMLK